MEERRTSRREAAKKHKQAKRRSLFIWFGIIVIICLAASAAVYGQFGNGPKTQKAEATKADTKMAEVDKEAPDTPKEADKPAKEAPPAENKTAAPADVQVKVTEDSGFTGLTGRVIDTATKQPIADCMVETSDGSVSIRTDANGVFRLGLPRGEAVAITVSAPGYFSAVAAGSVDEGQTKTIDFELRPQSGNQTPPSPVAF